MPFLGPAANASVDSMGVAVTSSEGPVKSGTLGWLNSDAKNSAALRQRCKIQPSVGFSI